MLIEFKVENYKSFKDEVEFSMVGAKITSKGNKLDQENVFQVDEKLSLLKSAVIYGANASGKSNLLAALRFMREFIVNSSKETQARDAIKIEPFRLDTESEKNPSFFEIVFIANSKKYRYGFTVDTKQVILEWLFDTPKIRERKLFVRENGKINIAKAFSEGTGLDGKTRDNALFVSVVAQFNGKISQEVLLWFQNLEISGLNRQANYDYTIACLENNRYRSEIIEFIKQLDLGIEDIQVKTIKPDLSVLPEGIPVDLKERYMSSLAKKVVTTVHWKYNSKGEKTPELFDINIHESEGTRRLFGIAGLLINTLKQGKILFIDEFDSSLHPLITCAIIDLFNSNKTNPKNAQLVFITHDTNLLNNKIFRRDQIWFIEKDKQGATHLYSLVEYQIPREDSPQEGSYRKVRNDASFEDDYIRGRYGAIPFIGDLGRLLGDSDV